jgi:ClpP class serine protease
MANHVQALQAVYVQREIAPNTVANGVGVVRIKGELCNGESWWFDSYESIYQRFADCMFSDEVQVGLLQIGSPGGDAEGLNATCDAMRRVKRKARKPVVCYCDDGAYSAAYALACVADEIYIPRAGGVGSIGVIAGIVSIVGALKKQGVDVSLHTTGKRKADGNQLAPITPGAKRHVQRHVDFLAGIYYQLVSDARGLEVAEVQSLEADTFYGRAAVKRGLADGIMSLDEVLRLSLRLARTIG